MSLACPVCGTQTNSAGDRFGSLRAVALHIAGSAQSYRWDHRDWIEALDLSTDGTGIDELSINRLASLIKRPLESHLEYEAAVREDRLETFEDERHPFLLYQSIERETHRYIEVRLKGEYGSEGRDWWYEGVPGGIRDKATSRREAEKSELHSFQFLDLLDIWRILDKEWRLFKEDLEAKEEKKGWEERFRRINSIRKKIAHPARHQEPTEEERTILEETYNLLSEVTSGMVPDLATESLGRSPTDGGTGSAEPIDSPHLEPEPSRHSEVTSEDFVERLRGLPGIGPLKAQAIPEAGISSIEELLEHSPKGLAAKVPGIGPMLASSILQSAEERFGR